MATKVENALNTYSKKKEVLRTRFLKKLGKLHTKAMTTREQAKDAIRDLNQEVDSQDMIISQVKAAEKQA